MAAAVVNGVEAVIGEILTVLGNHPEIVNAVVNLVKRGASKESILAALKTAEIEASDAIEREELGLPPK